MIDPEIENAAIELSVAARKELDKICLDAGMTQEEIQKMVEEAMSGITLNGVPIKARTCPNCEGKGWVMPKDKA